MLSLAPCVSVSVRWCTPPCCLTWTTRDGAPRGSRNLAASFAAPANGTTADRCFAETRNVRVDGLHGNACRAVDVDDLELSVTDQLVYGRAAHAEQSRGTDDGHEARGQDCLGRGLLADARARLAVTRQGRDLATALDSDGWTHLGPRATLALFRLASVDIGHADAANVARGLLRHEPSTGGRILLGTGPRSGEPCEARHSGVDRLE